MNGGWRGRSRRVRLCRVDSQGWPHPRVAFSSGSVAASFSEWATQSISFTLFQSCYQTYELPQNNWFFLRNHLPWRGKGSRKTLLSVLHGCTLRAAANLNLPTHSARCVRSPVSPVTPKFALSFFISIFDSRLTFFVPHLRVAFQKGPIATH